LMGHAAGSVGERHYTAMTPGVLAKLRDAVESIQLDLSNGEVIALPMRAVGGVVLAPQTVGLTAAFTAGRTKQGEQSPMISRARHRGFEPLTYGSGGPESSVQESAPERNTPDSAATETVQSAPECTHGADSDARSKHCGVPAVRIEEAIKALLAGDVEAARRLLA
jgi:hypothetical protein